LQVGIRLNIPQNEIVIGVPGYADEKELTIGNLLKLPFTKIRLWKQVNEVRDAGVSLPGKNNLAE